MSRFGSLASFCLDPTVIQFVFSSLIFILFSVHQFCINWFWCTENKMTLLSVHFQVRRCRDHLAGSLHLNQWKWALHNEKKMISRSFLPEQSLTFCNTLHFWKEDKFHYTMIYRFTLISFNYHGHTGIYDKVHGLTREVDTYNQTICYRCCMNLILCKTLC